MSTPSLERPQYSVYDYALLQAAAQADIEVVTDCLENGAYSEVTDAKGRTALILACGQSYQAAVKVVELLLGCRVNAAQRDVQNCTAAHAAARVGNDQVLLRLKAAGAPMDSLNLDLKSPLHFAKNHRCVSALLGAGARCFVENKDGNTPLMTSIIRGDSDSVEVFLQYGAKPLARCKTGHNAVSIAWARADSRMLHLLYEYSAPSGANTANHAEDSADFGDWLVSALKGTPAELGTIPAAGSNHVPTTQFLGTSVWHAPVLGSDDVTRPYFDLDELDQAMRQPMDEERPKYLKQMKARGNMRVLKQVPGSFDFSGLRLNFPNFEKVSDFLERQVELCRLAPSKVAAFQPLLLLGDPGVGKTRYLLEISELLDLEFGLIQCGGVSANFVLSGSTTSWKNGKPGRIHTALRDGKTLNPIIMLDEIDKLNGSLDYDAHGPLYQLLESKTAKTFQDECVEVAMDCSRIIWVATANHLSTIPEAIVSRLTIIDVPPPTGEGLIRVAKSVFRDVLAANLDSWGGRFAPDLADAVLAHIGEQTPREIRKCLLSACGNAAMRCARKGNFVGTVALTVEDLDSMPVSGRARGIGFGSAT